MKVLKILMMIIFISINSYSQSSVSNETTPEIFEKMLKDADLLFVRPAGSVSVDQVAHSPVKYEYALFLKGKDVEVRYSIWPLSKGMFEIYERREKKTGDTILHPNKIHKVMAQFAFSQISGGKIPQARVKLNSYTSVVAKKEFGADAAYMFMGPIDSKYSNKYQFGFFVVLQKDFAGYAFVSYLFPDQKAMFDQMQDIANNHEVFKALIFKK